MFILKNLYHTYLEQNMAYGTIVEIYVLAFVGM